MTSIIIPIFVCVILPVSIVLIDNITAINRNKTRASVLMKAIECNNNIDANKLAEAFAEPRKSAREILNLRLLRGCIFSLIGLGLIIVGVTGLLNEIAVSIPLILGGASLAIGISYLVVYFVTRREIAEDSPEKK